VTEPRFLVGVGLFALGMMINWQADDILRNLRKPGETGYRIPRGGAFELVSGANFFGEILEWAGFAVAAGSLPAAAFAIFTFCNIAPRGYQHHRWYLGKFKGEYPPHRKAIIPLLW
jgi:3-oxo-5-alpha-steroid 4-dehydrogenase 1